MDPALYPDVAAYGSLQAALRAQFDRPLSVTVEAALGQEGVSARVAQADRLVTVHLGAWERAFLLEFWADGVRLSGGITADLTAVAGAIGGWFDGYTVRRLHAEYPFASCDPLAEAYERGEAAAYLWRTYHENRDGEPHLAQLHAFIALAIAQPRLYALRPGTSLNSLCLAAGPSVTPLEDGRYLIRAANGRRLGTADAAGAVALVLAALDRP